MNLIAATCLKNVGMGLHAPFSHDGAFADVQTADYIGNNAPLYHQRHRLLNRVLITSDMVPLLFSSEEMASMLSRKNFKFTVFHIAF